MKSAVSPQVTTIAGKVNAIASKPHSSTGLGATVKPACSQCITPCLWPTGTHPSLQANYRKGGLLCLAASAVGLADHGHEFLQRIVPPVLNSFTDQDSRVRYYACEVCGCPHLHSWAQISALSAHLPSLHICAQAWADHTHPLPALPPAAGAPTLVTRKGKGLATPTLECCRGCLWAEPQCQGLKT